MISDDFCAFILTHGRPDNVVTYNRLKAHGYTGKVYIVIDDEDATAARYYENFGDKVLMFSKEEMSKKFDEGDNFGDRRCIVYARNACFDLAKQVGCKYFIQLDDDYDFYQLRVLINEGKNLHGAKIHNLDRTIKSMLTLFKNTNATTVAMAQGGDYIGGAGNPYVRKGYKRKAMNSFICSTDRPFKFFGRLNEDVNFYTTEGRRGRQIYTIMAYCLNQKLTQTNQGGMTEIYLDKGTYFKSFYSIMYAPSCVKISLMGNATETMRIHHKVSWNNCAPKILSETLKKPANGKTA